MCLRRPRARGGPAGRGRASGQKDTHAGRAQARGRPGVQFWRHARTGAVARLIRGTSTVVDARAHFWGTRRWTTRGSGTGRGAGPDRGKSKGRCPLRGLQPGPPWILARAALLASFMVKPDASLARTPCYSTTTRFHVVTARSWRCFPDFFGFRCSTLYCTYTSSSSTLS